MPFDELAQGGWSGDSQATAQGASSDAAALRDELRLLQKRMDRLALLCQTLWTLVQEDRALSEGDLLDKMKEVERRNGRVDGRTVETRPCDACGRPLNARQPRCIYCGAERASVSIFETL